MGTGGWNRTRKFSVAHLFCIYMSKEFFTTANTVNHEKVATNLQAHTCQFKKNKLTYYEI